MRNTTAMALRSHVRHDRRSGRAQGTCHADLLKAGDKAPAFSTDAIYGDQTTPIKLSDYRGQTVVLNF